LVCDGAGQPGEWRVERGFFLKKPQTRSIVKKHCFLLLQSVDFCNASQMSQVLANVAKKTLFSFARADISIRVRSVYELEYVV
jgi:hypothetical protein